MRSGVIIGSLLLALTIFVEVPGVRALSSSELLRDINQTRRVAGKSSFRLNGNLNLAASLKLADMSMYHYWDHNNPVTLTQWSSFIRRTGYVGHIGENLASNFSDTDKVVDAWLKSPSHKDNLLSDVFQDVGIATGLVDFPWGTETVFVVEFGSGNRAVLQASR